MDGRFPLSLLNIEDLLLQRAAISAMRRSGFGGTGWRDVRKRHPTSARECEARHPALAMPVCNFCRKPALSQMVRGFEDRVGVQLLVRTTRSVALTEAGDILLRRVRPAVSELGSALGQVRRTRDRPAGTARVHAFRSAAERYIAPMLGAFAEAYPDVMVDLTLDDAVVDVVAGGFDAALRIGEVI